MRKRSLLAGCLALSMAFCVGTAVIAGQSVTSEPTVAVADEAKTAMTVADVNYTDNYAGWAGACVAVHFNVDSLGVGDWTDLASQSDKVTLVGSDGTARSVACIDAQGAYVRINHSSQSYVCSVGDILTIKAGFTVGNYEVKTDISYQYKTANTAWVVYTGAEETPEPETELTIASGYYVGDLTWSAPAMTFVFNTAKEFALYQSAETLNLIEYKNAYGETVPVSDCISVGNGNFLLRWSPKDSNGTFIEDSLIYAMAGDTVTFKAGFALSGNEKLKNDVKYVVTSTTSGALALYSAECEPKGLSITTSDEYKQISANASVQLEYALTSGYGTPIFTSSNSGVATVTKGGLVTGVAEGNATITATIGSMSVNFAVEVLPASPIKEVEIVNQYTVYVAQNEALKLPDFKAHVVFENGRTGTDFALTESNCTVGAVDTSKLGSTKTTLTITYQGKPYEVDLFVKVYEITDLVVKEIAVVEWFSFAIFVECPESSSNVGNITSGFEKLDSVFDHIVYQRADGTELPVSGGYILGEGNIAFMPHGADHSKITLENMHNYYKNGDTITLKKGLKLWSWTGEVGTVGSDNKAVIEGTGMYICDAILPYDVVYTYSTESKVWSVTVEYTDVTAKSTDLTIATGKTVSAGVSRVPSNATTGSFTYVSSDETIATVSKYGVIKGIKDGTCTVTVTLNGGAAGEKKIVLNVTVADSVVGLEFGVESVTIKAGNTPDLSQISAKLKWASGKEGATVDLTNATIVGLDNTTVGEQQVVITVSVDGVNYSGSLMIIVVEGDGTTGGNGSTNGGSTGGNGSTSGGTTTSGSKKRGCGGGCSGTTGVFAPFVLLGAGIVLAKKKRK